MRKVEPSRHNTDDGRCSTIEPNCFADDGGILLIPLRPETIAQDHDRSGTGIRIGFSKIPPAERFLAQHLKRINTQLSAVINLPGAARIGDDYAEAAVADHGHSLEGFCLF